MTKETGEGREREWERGREKGREGERERGIERSSERARAGAHLYGEVVVGEDLAGVQGIVAAAAAAAGQQHKQWRTEAGAAAQAYEQAHRRAGTECWMAQAGTWAEQQAHMGEGWNGGRARGAGLKGLSLDQGKLPRRREQ